MYTLQPVDLKKVKCSAYIYVEYWIRIGTECRVLDFEKILLAMFYDSEFIYLYYCIILMQSMTEFTGFLLDFY